MLSLVSYAQRRPNTILMLVLIGERPAVACTFSPFSCFFSQASDECGAPASLSCFSETETLTRSVRHHRTRTAILYIQHDVLVYTVKCIQTTHNTRQTKGLFILHEVNGVEQGLILDTHTQNVGEC